MGLCHDHLFKKGVLEELMEEEAMYSRGYDRHKVDGYRIPHGPCVYQSNQVWSPHDQNDC